MPFLLPTLQTAHAAQPGRGLESATPSFFHGFQRLPVRHWLPAAPAALREAAFSHEPSAQLRRPPLSR